MPAMGAGTLGEMPSGGDIDKSTFAPQPTGKIVHEWERQPVASKAPRLQGKKVWKKLMRAFGASGEDEKLQQVQAELETAGAGTRKKMRMTSTKTNIRDAEWEGTEWQGFADDVMAGVQAVVNENDSTSTARKRRKDGNVDKIVTPRKPLRQMSLDGQTAEKVEDVLDDEVAIAKRARKALRKSGGSRTSLLASDLTSENTTQSTDPFMDNTPANASPSRQSLSIFASPSKLSPSKRKLMRSKLTQQSRTTPSEPRRLSGALFGDASPVTIPPTINFTASTASPMQFGASAYNKFGAGAGAGAKASKSPQVGTPIRGASANVPRTAPAKIQPTRSEIEQEMASFFTPIPRLKKMKRRSSPIKSYLQQLLENREGDGVVKANQEAQDERTPTPERDSALEFARDVHASPVPSSPAVSHGASPGVGAAAEKDESGADEHGEDKVQVHAKLNAVASAVRLDFNLVPDLSMERIGSFADVESSDADEDTKQEAVSLIRDDNEDAVATDSGSEKDDFDPEEQLRLEIELAAAEVSESLADVDAETDEVDDVDELMLDAPTPSHIDSLNPENPDSTPAFESTIQIIPSPISHTPSSEESAIADSSDSSDSSNSGNINASFEDEETAMLLAFVTKNQAKKLARSSPKAAKSTSPLRVPLGDVTGNSSPTLTKKTANGGKIEKPVSPTKKSRRFNPTETAVEIPTDSLASNELPEPSSSVRRSGRVATKPVPSKIPAPPSFIPVRHLGADGTEVKAPKKEKTIEQITKLNTGKNKAGCLQPIVVLKRIKMEEKMMGKNKAESPKKKEKGEGGKERKKVVWKEELTVVREFDEKAVVRPVRKENGEGKKEKAEGKKVDDGKKRVRVGTASERAGMSKKALGMVGNGTPAKRKSREVDGGEKKEEKEMPVKKVRQPKLRSPKVRVAKAVVGKVVGKEKEKRDEDIVMG